MYDFTSSGSWIWASISYMSWCGTDPKTSLRSRKVTERGRLFWTAFWMKAEVAKVCSIVPLIAISQETFLETGIYDIIIAKEAFQLESQDFVKEFAYCWGQCYGIKVLRIGQILAFGNELNLGLAPRFWGTATAWSSNKIFENKIARKWWAKGNFFRLW